MTTESTQKLRFSASDLARWAGGEWSSPPPGPLTGVCHDTREIRSGELYIALRGERFDGHDFVAQAIEAGAAGAMVESSWSGSAEDGSLLVVEDTRQSLGALALGWRQALGVSVIGITGSAGKTTVKELIGQFLERAGPTARTCGNWNNDIGLPMSMLQMRHSTRFGVFELGSNHPGEIGQLAATLAPDWGVVTNVGPAHIGMFGSLEAIAREKGSLLAALPSEGLAFLDSDGEFASTLHSMSAAPVVTTSLQGDADYRGRIDEGEAWRLDICESASGESHCFELPRPGEDMARNLLLTVAVCRRAGLSWGALDDSLREWQSPCQRWQEVRATDVLWINDAYNANPLSVQASLIAFAAMGGPMRKWLVLGDMLELGESTETLHRSVGEQVADGEWAGLVTVGELAVQISRAAVECGFGRERVMTCRSVDEAVEALRKNLKPGDAVLLKGSRAVGLEGVVNAFVGPKK